jgi:hypothetical protein
MNRLWCVLPPGSGVVPVSLFINSSSRIVSQQITFTYEGLHAHRSGASELSARSCAIKTISACTFSLSLHHICLYRSSNSYSICSERAVGAEAEAGTGTSHQIDASRGRRPQ